MKLLQQAKNYFTKGELCLWGGSVTMILLTYLLFDGNDTLTLAASLIGATSLIFNAKGNPFGQLLMVVFSAMYGVISYRTAYYGEMITYLGMTAPMAVAALVNWLRHPYQGSHAQVAVGRLRRGEPALLAVLTVIVTAFFYFILRELGTASLGFSTLSVTTSFAAVYLTWRRSPYFALAYAANDVVLLVLWSMAANHDPGCISVIVCFVAFLVNDLYGLFNWLRMQQKQAEI